MKIRFTSNRPRFRLHALMVFLALGGFGSVAHGDEAARQMADGRLDWVQIDGGMRSDWASPPCMRYEADFVPSPRVSSEQRATWFWLEMDRIWKRSMQRSRESVAAADFDAYLQALLRVADEPAARENDDKISDALNRLHSLQCRARLGSVGEQRVLDKLKSSSDPLLRSYAEGRQREMDMREHPLELQLTLMDGSILDVASLRGKVLLIDFWSVNCTPCLNALPEIRRIHTLYHDEGFEVIGVCLGMENSPAKVQALLQRMNISWPNAWESWGISPLRRRFGIFSVPVYFLLDQSGRLVGTDFSGSEGRARLELEVRRLLREPADASRTGL